MPHPPKQILPNRFQIGSKVTPEITLGQRAISPIDKIPGVSTEDILALSIPPDTNAQMDVKTPRTDANYSSEKFQSDIVQGILKRARVDVSYLDDVKALLDSRLKPTSSERQPSPQRSIALSAFKMRGFLEVDDRNIVAPLVLDGVPIVGIQWSQVSRHDYPNFEEQILFTLKKGETTLTAQARPGSYAKGTYSDNRLNAMSASAVLLDLFFPTVLNTKKGEANIERAEKRLIMLIPGLGEELLGATIDKNKIPGAPFIEDQDDQIWVTAHPAARYSYDGVTLTLEPPIPWITRDDQRGIIVIEAFETDGQGNIIAPTTSVQAFAEMKSSAFSTENNELIKLTELATLTGSQPDLSQFPKSGVIRIALAQPKILAVTGYGVNAQSLGVNFSRILCIEGDLADNICVCGRYMSPGRIEMSGGKELPLASIGDAAMKVFHWASTVSPPTPSLKSILSDQWNFLFQWETSKAVNNRYESIFDSTTGFDFRYVVEPLLQTATRRPADLVRTLPEVVSALKSGDWNISDLEINKMRLWLNGETLNNIDPPSSDGEWQERVNAIDSAIVLDGKIWLGPPLQINSGVVPTDVSAFILTDEILGAQRRENFRWRFQFRAVENANDPSYRLRSDWTTPTDWFLTRPIIPALISQIRGPRTKTSPPTNTITVYLDALNRSFPLPPDLSYQLIVRKLLTVVNSLGDVGGVSQAMVSDCIVPLEVAAGSAGNAEIKFSYIDHEVVSMSDIADSSFFYTYEVEVNQLFVDSNGQKKVVAKTFFDPRQPILQLAPESSISIRYREPTAVTFSMDSYTYSSSSISEITTILKEEGWVQHLGNTFSIRDRPHGVLLPLNILSYQNLAENKVRFHCRGPFFTAYVTGARMSEDNHLILTSDSAELFLA